MDISDVLMIVSTKPNAQVITFADLPVDCIAIIARSSMHACWLMAVTHRAFGLWTIGKFVMMVDWFRTIGRRGSTCYNGLLHSFNDEPVYQPSLILRWYRNGKLHRDHELPAVINNAVSIYRRPRYERWVDGKLHSWLRPTIEEASGRKEWWKNGIKIRDNDNEWW